MVGTIETIETIEKNIKRLKNQYYQEYYDSLSKSDYQYGKGKTIEVVDKILGILIDLSILNEDFSIGEGQLTDDYQEALIEYLDGITDILRKESIRVKIGFRANIMDIISNEELHYKNEKNLTAEDVLLGSEDDLENEDYINEIILIIGNGCINALNFFDYTRSDDWFQGIELRK